MKRSPLDLIFPTPWLALALLLFLALCLSKSFLGNWLDGCCNLLLLDFVLYIKTVNNYLLAVEKDQASSRVKLATLQALGGPDMVDLLEHIGKVVLTGTPGRAADPDNDVEDVEEVLADTYEQGIDKIRKGIVPHSNQAMS